MLYTFVFYFTSAKVAFDNEYNPTTNRQQGKIYGDGGDRPS